MNDHARQRNLILRSQSDEILASFFNCAERVWYNPGASVVTANKEIEFIDFPEYGVFSFVHSDGRNQYIEVATTGNEGVLGFAPLLGVDTMPEQIICQVAGQAWRVTKSQFVQLVEQHPSLRRACLRHVAAMIHQVSINAVCSRYHTATERCARFLLLTQDRTDSNTFKITQKVLAQMLNVSRTRINATAYSFAKNSIIKYVRGEIVILEREQLLAAVCSCYRLLSPTMS